MDITAADRTLIRELARQVADCAAGAENQRLRAAWTAHNSLVPGRPLVLIFPEGSWGEILPPEALSTSTKDAQGIERTLRQRLYDFQHFRTDAVVDDSWHLGPVVTNTGWGLEASRHDRPNAGGSWAFEPVITSADDLQKLRYPEWSYDADATRQRLAEHQELFGDILTIGKPGRRNFGYHLMQQFTGWRGLTEGMMDMVAEPQLVHDVMAFLEEGHRRTLQFYCDHNLLQLNNDNTYHSSGGNGFTTDLPAPGFDPNRVRPCDLWASAESQELAQVSPEMHAEFALPYERRLLAPFGLNGYGCCEDLTLKLADVTAIPKIRRISISPWADVAACAAQLGGKYIFSWKPQPADLCGEFDPEKIRTRVRRTRDVAREHGCVLEIILKDTHTCQQHPERFDLWSQIVQECLVS